MTTHATRICGLTALAVVFVSATSVSAQVPAKVIVKQGDVFGLRTVSTVNAPFTDGNGKVGFVVGFNDATRGIWHNNGFVFNSSDALPDSLTGSESTMGVSDTGGFVYSPSFNGNDAVYTHAGKLLAGTDAISSLPGRFSTFNSRPTMLPNGTAFWMGGSAATQGGSTTNRHLFKAADVSDPMSIVPVLSGGDVVGGFPISTAASNFTYHISDNGAHHIHIIDQTTGSSANNLALYYNGDIVARESGPIISGGTWVDFDGVSVNNVGEWVVAGNTSGPASQDEVIAFKGEVKVREGDTIGGVTLASGATVRGVSINNLSEVVHIWGWGSGGTAQEHLFFGNGSTLSDSIRLLSRGDVIDVDNDTIGDYIVDDFNASFVIGPGLSLAEDGFVYLDVDLIPVAGGASQAAIIRLRVPEPGTLGLLAFGSLLVVRRRR